MKAISLKAQGQAVNVRQLAAMTGRILRQHSVAIAVIGAATAYAGVLTGSDPLTYTAALAAMGAVGLTIDAQEGGDK